MGTFDDIRRQLTDLSTDELTELRGHITYLLSSGGGREKTIDNGSDVEFALQCIIDVLTKLRLAPPNIVALKKSKIMPDFRKKVALVIDHLKAGGFKRNDRRRMLMLALVWLHSDLVRRRKAATARMLMLNFDMVPAMLDQQYPYDLELINRLAFRSNTDATVGKHESTSLGRRGQQQIPGSSRVKRNKRNGGAAVGAVVDGGRASHTPRAVDDLRQDDMVQTQDRGSVRRHGQ